MAAFYRFQKTPRLFSMITRSSRFVCSPLAPARAALLSTANILTMVKSEKDPEKIGQNLEKYLKKRCSKYHNKFYDRSVRKLADLQRFDIIERVLELQKKTQLDSDPIDEGLLVRIMMLYSSAKMIEQAIRTFDQVEELGIARTGRSIGALLAVYAENEQFDQVHKLFAEIPEKFGVSPDVVAYNVVIKAFVGKKEFESACSLLEKMEEDGIKPNAISYNTLLSALIKDKKKEKFDEILKQMEEKGVEPDVVTYNYKMAGLCSNGKSSKARELLEEMISKEIKPTIASFNVVIDGFCSEGDFESAKKVLEFADSNNYHLNRNSYFTIINNAIRGNNFDLALDLCKMVLKRNWIPSSRSINVIIKNLIKDDKADKAKLLIEELKKKNLDGAYLEPTIKMLMGLDIDSCNSNNAYLVVINYAIELEDFELAFMLCKKSIEKKLDPPLATLEKLVKGLKKISKDDGAKMDSNPMRFLTAHYCLRLQRMARGKNLMNSEANGSEGG